MFHLRRFRAAASTGAVLGLATAVLAACGSPPSNSTTSGNQAQASAPQGLAAIAAAAKKEGTFTIYSGFTDSANKAIFSAFEAQYGVKGVGVKLTTAPMEQRFLSEANAGAPGADILFGAPPTFYDQDSQYFVPINSSEIPEVANWPKNALGPNYVEWLQTPMVVAYSTKLAKSKVPSTWSQIATGAYSGQIALSDPRVSSNYLGWAEAMKNSLGTSYLKQIGKLNPTVESSGSTGAQLVAAGSKELSFPTFPGLVQPVVNTGAPIAYKPLTNPTVYNAFDVAIPKDARHPNAARLFLNWLMTPAALQIVCKVNPTAVPLDPTGKLGCIPLGSSAQPISYDVSKGEQAALFNALGL